LAGDVRDRGFGVTQAAKQRLRRIHDTGAGIVGLDLGLYAHRSPRRLMTDEFNKSSGGWCQADSGSSNGGE
jgi:hypothetical protein